MGRTFGNVTLFVIVFTLAAAIALLYFHKSTEVELQLASSRVDFTVVDPQGVDCPVYLADCLIGSSLELWNFEPVVIEAESLYDIDAGQSPMENKRIFIIPSDPEFSRLTLKGRDLALTDLQVPSNSRVMLNVVEEGSIELRVVPEPEEGNASSPYAEIRGTVSMAGSVEVWVDRCEIVDENGDELFANVPQRRLMIDLFGGSIVDYRSDSTACLSINLMDEPETELTKALGIYDPADESWTVKRSPLPMSVPDAVTFVADGKIYLVEGGPSPDRERPIPLLNDNLHVKDVKFSLPSPANPLVEMTIPVEEGRIIFDNEKLGEVLLRCEFLEFKEGDSFRLLNTSLRNGQLDLLLVGRPRSILAGSQPETLRDRRPTWLKWLYVNPEIAMVIAVFLGVIGLLKQVKDLVKKKKSAAA